MRVEARRKVQVNGRYQCQLGPGKIALAAAPNIQKKGESKTPKPQTRERSSVRCKENAQHFLAGEVKPSESKRNAGKNQILQTGDYMRI